MDGHRARAEGITVVRPVAGVGTGFVAAHITLGVASGLDWVGLTARVASALAGSGIACNVVAGARHDHLFVPSERAAEAMAVLGALDAAGHGPLHRGGGGSP